MILISLPAGQGRSTTSSTAASLNREPSIANKIFMANLLIEILHRHPQRSFLCADGHRGDDRWFKRPGDQDRARRLSQHAIGVRAEQRSYTEARAARAH